MSGVTISIVIVAFFGLLGIAFFTICGIVFVGTVKDWRRRHTPLNRIIKEGKTIHSVGPDTQVSECVRLMTGAKIGALVVVEGERLTGIFTERDALNKVLAGGLDPRNTKVSEVMTKDPYSVPPTMTVGDAMKLITRARFRHLPIADHGKFLAVISSGDLTHWLVQDQTDEVPEGADVAART